MDVSIIYDFIEQEPAAVEESCHGQDDSVLRRFTLSFALSRTPKDSLKNRQRREKKEGKK